MGSLTLGGIGFVFLLALIVSSIIVLYEFGPLLWARYTVRTGPQHMSIFEDLGDDLSSVDDGFVDNAPEPLHVIATPSNEYNGPLSVAESAMLEAVALLIRSSNEKGFHAGVIGETRAIETVFKCRRSSDENSKYQLYRGELKKRLKGLELGAPRAQFPELTPEQKALRDELGLDMA